MALDRRLVTIVAADVVGYARLVARDEDGILTRFRALRTDLIDPEIETAGGRLVKSMGDGLLLEFASPVAALRTAIAVQTAIAAHEASLPQDQRIRFRVGINLGDVVIDGDDILGDGVNIAARLESLAPPGGICISKSVRDHVNGKVDAALIPMGPQQVKNIPDPVEVWRVDVAGADAAAPGRASPAERPSLLVLPFDDMSADPDQAFLADGIVEDVTTELSRFRTLTVIARNSAFAYKDTHKDIREIAAEMGVRYVVEGSVRRAGERLRVSAQLIEAETGAHIWAERWDRTMADLFDVQDELTQAIVTGVEPELGAHERAVARRKPTENLTAWELYQRGYAEYLRPTDWDYAHAFGYLTDAIAADPEFALPHAVLGFLYFYHVAVGRAPDREKYLHEGLRHARRAVELDNRQELGYVALGFMLTMAGQGREAREALAKAEALNRNTPHLHFARGIEIMWRDAPDPDELEAVAPRGLRDSPKDPLEWNFHFLLGVALLLRNGSFADPELCEAFLAGSRSPESEFYVFLPAALACVSTGRFEEARALIARALEQRPELTHAIWTREATTAFWKKLIAVTRDEQERLIELGLPRE